MSAARNRIQVTDETKKPDHFRVAANIFYELAKIEPKDLMRIGIARRVAERHLEVNGFKLPHLSLTDGGRHVWEMSIIKRLLRAERTSDKEKETENLTRHYRGKATEMTSEETTNSPYYLYSRKESEIEGELNGQ